MNKNISRLFKQEPLEQRFSKIKITLASPEKIKSWSFGEIKNLKQLIIEHLDLKKMDFFVREFLDQLRITSAYAGNTKE